MFQEVILALKVPRDKVIFDVSTIAQAKLCVIMPKRYRIPFSCAGLRLRDYRCKLYNPRRCHFA